MEGASSPSSSAIGEWIRGLREYKAERLGPLSTSSTLGFEGVSSSHAVASVLMASYSRLARSDSSTEPWHNGSEPRGSGMTCSWSASSRRWL